MKQILRITIGLTISCLIAAVLMGVVFTITAKAKKHNEHQQVQDTMLQLLGYGKGTPPPSDLRLYNIYRYVLEAKGNKYLGYIIPVKRQGEIRYTLLVMNLNGTFNKLMALDLEPEEVMEDREREAALRKALNPSFSFTYGGETVVAMAGDKRLAYLVRGEFQGYKTFIQVMLALDPSFSVLGMEVMEHEEDPGLGGEIEQDYFKNQFNNKTFERLKELDVVKQPLPEEYRKYLEPELRQTLTPQDLESIKRKYQETDIYALTGATISSKAVTDGVKNAAVKFAYRMETLDRVIAEQGVPAAF
jgi:electron transport complex protein RnfG